MQTVIQTSRSVRQTLWRMLATLCVLCLPALAGAAPFAYISNQLDDNVSVIDTATNTVVTTIGVGDFPDAVAVNPAGTRVYVTNRSDNTVSVINTSTNTVLAVVTVGTEPRGVVVNPAGTRVYVTNNGLGAGGSSVSVIDAANNTVTATVPVGSQPWGVAINPAGTRVYVANYGDDNVSIIDATNNTEVGGIGGRVVVQHAPLGIAINPAGTRLYVGNSLGDLAVNNDGSISVIDTANNTVINTVVVAEAPYGIVVNPAGTRVYVVNCCANAVSVIDTSSNTVIGVPIAVGNQPSGISINQAGTRLYVVNAGDGTVSVIDTATNAVVGTTITVGGQPQSFGNFIGPGGTPTPAPVPVPTDPIPFLPPLPGVPGIGTQPTVLNLAGGQGPAMTDCLLATVRKLFGADALYLGQNANGVAKISQGGRVISFYPLQASTNVALSIDIHLSNSNVLNIGTSCGDFNVTPALYNLTEFGALLNGMGLVASINAQGVMTMIVGDKVYVARPDYLTALGATGPVGMPSLVQGVDGLYRFTDSTSNMQVLRPAFLDTDALSAQVSVRGGWTLIQTDGSAIFTIFSGQSFTLMPDLTLSRAAPESAASLSWQDGANHYQFRSNTLVMSQGLGVQGR